MCQASTRRVCVGGWKKGCFCGTFKLMPRRTKDRRASLRYTSSNGFTLIELLIAVSVLALVAAVAVPNLRQFNEDQDLNNTKADLLRVLKQTQSQALSKINCSAKPSVSWSVELSSSGYRQIASCQEISVDPSPTLESKPIQNFPANKIELSSSSCGDSSTNPNATITFTGSTISFSCANGASPSLLFSIILRNRVNSETKTIKIDQGGAIYEE